MESRSIHFVTWPDGKVSDASMTVVGAGEAKRRIIQEWLPEGYFGKIEPWDVDRLWRGMRDKGFRCHSFNVSESGEVTREENY